MEEIHAIKPGPKPKTEAGEDDRRRRVDPPNQPKHPDLKPHVPKPKEKKIQIIDLGSIINVKSLTNALICGVFTFNLVQLG